MSRATSYRTVYTFTCDQCGASAVTEREGDDEERLPAPPAGWTYLPVWRPTTIGEALVCSRECARLLLDEVLAAVYEAVTA